MLNGETVRRWREERKLTQAEFGKMIDKSQASVSELEQGRQPLTWDDMVRVSEVTNISLDTLAGRESVSIPVVMPGASGRKMKLNIIAPIEIEIID